MTREIAQVDQYRTELRQTVEAGVFGHQASFADGTDPSFAFQGCVEMLYRAAVENSQNDPARAIQHLAGLASEALIMLALKGTTTLPDMTEEEREASSRNAALRQAQALDEDYAVASTMVTNMLSLYQTSHMRDSDHKYSWDLLRAYVAEQARIMANDGIPADTITDRLAGLVARALLVSIHMDGMK
jgi:hypothetical protein